MFTLISGITCAKPPNPANGFIGGNEIWPAFYDARALYFCNPGYALIGQEQRRCQENGQWTGSNPSCRSTYSKTNFFFKNLTGIMYTSSQALGLFKRNIVVTVSIKVLVKFQHCVNGDGHLGGLVAVTLQFHVTEKYAF